MNTSNAIQIQPARRAQTTAKQCCNCNAILDNYEIEYDDCVFCFLNREKELEQFVNDARTRFRQILNSMGGTAGADRLGDPSPWRENAVRALEDALSLFD